MVVGATTVAVGGLDVPVGGGMVHDAVPSFVTGARAGTLVHGRHAHRPVLLLDGHGGHGAVEVGATLTMASSLLGALPASPSALAGGGHGGMEGGELVHHALVLVLLVGVDGLCMLAEVVEARKLFGTVTSERPFARMFPEHDRATENEMATSATKSRHIGGGEGTCLMCLARCSLLLKTILHSP